jgi:hypothetical protein
VRSIPPLNKIAHQPFHRLATEVGVLAVLALARFEALWVSRNAGSGRNDHLQLVIKILFIA